MKPLLLLSLLFFASLTFQVQASKHKSEAELKQMTPSQRVDESVREYAHRFDLSDRYGEIVDKYVLQDGLKALPRIIEIIDEYDPTRSSGRTHEKGERFDASWAL